MIFVLLVIGAYLGFACLPVGREFDYWNFSEKLRNLKSVVRRWEDFI